MRGILLSVVLSGDGKNLREISGQKSVTSIHVQAFKA